MGNNEINLAFAGYNRLFREGLRLLLGARFDIVNEAESFVDALRAMQADALNIHLLIGDPGSHSRTELDALSLISRQFPETKIIILTSETNQVMLDTVLKSGAAGVLSNDISGTALLYCIEIVLLGERIVPTFMPPAVRNTAHVASPPPPIANGVSELTASLSTREREILQCLVNGLSNKLISRELSMSESTVKVHLKMMLRKLRIQNRTQAAVWALNHGILQNNSRKIELVELEENSDQVIYADPLLRQRSDSLQALPSIQH
jgi:two-component system nitrate/nitrite response regulator NarL